MTVHDPTIRATYVLTLHTSTQSDQGRRLRKEFLGETEENISDLLPIGWWVEIHEWDEPDFAEER